MNRRDFFTLVGVEIAAWPLGARAQTKVPTIGVLTLGIPDPGPFLQALREGLRDRGYSEGRNIRLDTRTAEGQPALLAEKAAELVRLKVDVIVAFQTPAAMAARDATSEIPIVLGEVGDPVGSGLVASLARPGGNITGLSGGVTEIVGKVVELTREMLPTTRRVAALANLEDPFAKLFVEGVGAGARNAGIAMEPVVLRPADPLEAAFEMMTGRQVDAVITMTTIFRREVVDLAMKHRLPLLSSNRMVPASGGLASYSSDRNALWRESAVYIDKILKGSKPAGLPVAFPTRFELVINLKTAKELGLEVPPTLVARADEVIE
jgi:putative ABC transport system substrate-binding protein